jgi:hypothetical protein
MTNEELIAFFEARRREALSPEYKGVYSMTITSLKSSWTVEKRKERAEWLKRNIKTYDIIHEEITKIAIEKAFELQEPTLEEKFQELRKKHDKQYPSSGAFWDAVGKDFELASRDYFRDYFKTHPQELEK